MSTQLKGTLASTVPSDLTIHRISLTWLVGLLQSVAFGAAILMPALYLPILANGLGNVNEFGYFMGLISLHIAALIVGQEYPSRHG